MTSTPEEPRPIGDQASTGKLNDAPKGLGGWLVVVGIGVVVSPFRQGFDLYRDTWQPLQDSAYFELLNSSSPNFIPYLKPLIIFETAMSTLLLLASVWIIFLYFAKHRLFPKVFVGVFSFTVGFSALDAFLACQIFETKVVFDGEFVKNAVRLLVSTCIWVPYMLVSRRVKNTFVG